jgi:hypothetical protein
MSTTEVTWQDVQARIDALNRRMDETSHPSQRDGTSELERERERAALIAERDRLYRIEALGGDRR